MSDENMSEHIECPFCGKGSVLAKIGITYYFLSEHTMYKDGVDMDGDTIGEMIGEMPHRPVMEYKGFRCTSCGKKWHKRDYEPVKDENGRLSFVMTEKTKRKGTKKSD